MGTVLIAESDKDLRARLTTLLSAEGYGVVEVGSGRDAVGAVRHSGVDIAILSVDLPDIGGHRLAPILLDLAPDLPIVVTTRESSETMEREARQVPLIFFAVLPGDLEFLPAVVRRAMGVRARQAVAG